MSQHNGHIDALLKSCIQGEQSAQLEIYNRYYLAMYNTAYRIVKNKAEAEDVMQESFLRAFAKLHTFKGDLTFGAWLKRIVINNSIDHYKKQQKNRMMDLDEVMYKVDDNVGIPYDQKDDIKMNVQKVIESIQSLKDNYRISLTLHLIEGYDYQEISEIMNMSYANCRTTISRAKEHLRKKLTINAPL